LVADDLADARVPVNERAVTVERHPPIHQTTRVVTRRSGVGTSVHLSLGGACLRPRRAQSQRSPTATTKMAHARSASARSTPDEVHRTSSANYAARRFGTRYASSSGPCSASQTRSPLY